jgi:hypothetical protein
MAATSADVTKDQLVPEPGALIGFIALGIAAVVVLPRIATDLPHLGRPEQAQRALTALGVLASTAAYLFAAARSRAALGVRWLPPTLAYALGLVIVKMILSPEAFRATNGASLTSFLTTGLAFVPLYLGALLVMYRAVERGSAATRGGRTAVALALAVVAVGARLLAALVLGNASEYLGDLLGRGLVFPVVVAVASFAVLESFVRAGRAAGDSLKVAIAVVLVHHVVWVVYMIRLFR